MMTHTVAIEDIANYDAKTTLVGSIGKGANKHLYIVVNTSTKAVRYEIHDHGNVTSADDLATAVEIYNSL